MIDILTLNSIDPIVKERLGEDFNVASECDAPEGILVRSAKMHDMELPASLSAVARAGAGVNNIPIDRCSDKGIVVFNTPGANANAVKELVLTGLLLSGRKVIDAVNWLKGLEGQEGVAESVEKNKNNFIGHELRGKKLGVIGLGAIGAMVSNAAYYGLNMSVIGFDPFISVESAWGLSRNIKRAMSQNEIFEECDYISVHVPLMEKTRSLISDAQIARMKDGAVLLNFARGELVDNKAVLAALASGKLRMYVTDFPNEELLGKEGVLAIPHLGASTPESEQNCAAMAADELREYIKDGNIHNSVNFPDCFLARGSAFRMAVLHRNTTNMVGQMTTALAKSDINIANMVNRSRGAYAYTIFELDHEPTLECVKAIALIEGVLKVRVL